MPNVNRHRSCFHVLIVAAYLIASVTDSPGAESFDFSPPHPALTRERWRTFEELSDVQCVAEDKGGRLWFGTTDGIRVYDGLRFSRVAIPDSLMGNDIRALGQSQEDGMYVATDTGIGRFHGEKWSTVFAIDEVPQWPRARLRKAVDGSIWATVVFGGIHLTGSQFTLYTTEHLVAAVRNVLPDVPTIVMPEGMAEQGAWFHEVYPDRRGRIWFGLSTGAIVRHDPRENSWIRYDSTTPGFSAGRLPTIYEREDGSFWVVSRDAAAGIDVYDSRSWSGLDLGDLSSRYMASVIETPDGTMWVGCHKSDLVSIRDGAVAVFGRGTIPTPQNILSELLLSSDGALWVVGQTDAAIRMDRADDRWMNYQDLRYQCQGSDDAVWFLTADNEVVRRSGDRWMSFSEEDGLALTPFGLLCQRDGRIWASGHQDSVAAVARFEGGRWETKTHPALSWSIHEVSAFEAADGSVWFAGEADQRLDRGQKGGVLRYRSDTGWVHFVPEGERPNTIPDVPPEAYTTGQTADGTLWFGGNRLRRFDGRNWARVTEHRGLDTWIHSLLGTSDGDLWVGTRTFGVLHLEDGAWTQYSLKDGLPDRRINALIQTPDDVVWASTNKGIARFDGRTWLSTAPALPLGWEGDDLWLKRGPGETVWMVTNGESLHYRPDRRPPETTLVQFQEEVAQPGYTTLSWTGADLWDDTPRDELQFSWRLDGGAWSPFSNARNHLFRELDSGTHVFEVKSRDRDYNTDPTPASATFAVTPPIWQQPWFVSLIGVLAVALGVQTNRVFRRDRRLVRTNIELEESSRAKSAFLANISHEIRTPLNAILGYAQILQADTSMSEEQKHAVRTIGTSGDHLLALINDVLDLSKIEAGREVLQETDFALENLVQDLSAMFRLRAEAKGLTWEVAAPVGPLRVYGDQGKLRQVLINLLGNAVKFCESGKVSLSITPDADRGTRFCVRDTGPGIPADRQATIFEPFQQEAVGLAVGGSGLGLAIACRQVEMMGGRLAVVSKPGEGTEFSFILPLPVIGGAGGHAETVDEENWDTATRVSGDRIVRALVVDDVLENRDLLQKVLDRVGVEVTLAAGGEEALARAREAMPDIVFLDIYMPGLSGQETFARLRSEHRDACPPVVAVSASVLDHQREEILASGFDDLIGKPVQLDLVYKCLAEQLNVSFEHETGPSVVVPESPRLDPVVVPSSILRSMIDAARGHNLTKLRGHIDELAGLGAREAELADRLNAMARQYDMDAILESLNEVTSE